MALFGQPKPVVTQASTFSPQQQALQNSVIQQALQLLPQVAQQKGVNFQPIAQKARTNFYQQTVPGLAERFTALGAGPRYSPGFAQTLGTAGAGLEESLAALESQYDLQRQNQLQSLLGGLLSGGLGKGSLENIISPSQPGFLESILSALLPGIGRSVSPILQAGFGGWGGPQQYGQI